DRVREQRDEVGVAGQSRVHALPRALGDRRAADVVAALEHEHRAALAGEISGGDQTVVAAADDHGVVGDDSASKRSAYGWPVASATGRYVTLPSTTLTPLASPGFSCAATATPLSATCRMYGSVALVSARVDVTGTAPGMLATQ